MTSKRNLVIILTMAVSFPLLENARVAGQNQGQSFGVGETPINRALPKPVRKGEKTTKRENRVRITFEKMKVGKMATHWKSDNKKGLWSIGNKLNSPSGVSFFQFQSRNVQGKSWMVAKHFQFKFPSIEVDVILGDEKSIGGIVWSGERKNECFSAVIDQKNQCIQIQRSFEGKNRILGTVAIPKIKSRWYKIGVSLEKNRLTVLFNGSPFAEFLDVKGNANHEVGLIAKGSVQFDNFDVRF